MVVNDHPKVIVLYRLTSWGAGICRSGAEILVEESRDLRAADLSGCRDLNPGPLAPKASALPTALHPEKLYHIT